MELRMPPYLRANVWASAAFSLCEDLCEKKISLSIATVARKKRIQFMSLLLEWGHRGWEHGKKGSHSFIYYMFMKRHRKRTWKGRKVERSVHSDLKRSKELVTIKFSTKVGWLACDLNLIREESTNGGALSCCNANVFIGLVLLLLLLLLNVILLDFEDVGESSTFSFGVCQWQQLAVQCTIQERSWEGIFPL